MKIPRRFTVAASTLGMVISVVACSSSSDNNGGGGSTDRKSVV